MRIASCVSRITSYKTHDARRTTQNAFTLVEVMVATAILSFGIVFVYESFFRLLDAFDYYENYVRVSPIVNEKMWQAQDGLEKFGPQAQIETRGEFLVRNKDFSWNLSYGLIEEIKTSSLYKIDFSISWKEGKRAVKLARNTYALYTKKE